MRTVVITGANRGIGLTLCKKFTESGDSVIAICRKASPELKNLGIQIYENVDVRSLEDLKRCHESMEGLAIDLLINNAGYLNRNDLDEGINFDEVEKQWQINACAPLKVAQTFLPRLSSGSKIIMVSSRMGSIADNTSGSHYGYRASKTALNMFSKSLSLDLKGRGISVLVLHPGYVKTDMTNQLGDIETAEAVEGMKRIIDEKGLESTGTFWHSNGQELPW